MNGFYAHIGVGNPHTAYSAAKFAVKGFSEALLEDFRVNAPHVKVAVVMPGHIGTDIVKNSRLVLGGDMVGPAEIRAAMEQRGFDHSQMSDEEVQNISQMMEEGFKTMAPTTAAQAATIILDGVRVGTWRILVGDDAREARRSGARRPRRRLRARLHRVQLAPAELADGGRDRL